MFGALKEKISQYFDGNVKLLQLNAVEKTAKILGFVSYGVMVLFIAMLVLVFLGMSLAELYHYLLNSQAWGYFLAAVTFVILSLILVFNKKKLMTALVNLFVDVLTEEPEVKGNEMDKLEQEVYQNQVLEKENSTNA